jgi:hypothetical protein
VPGVGISILSQVAVEMLGRRAATENTMVIRGQNTDKLRELASWYRDFAERAGNPTIWDSRLRTAEDLEEEADRVEWIVLTLVA